MQFTVALTMIDPTFYVPLARAAETAGYDMIALADSLCYPQESTSSYPYNADGTREFLDGKPFIEPFTLIGALSVATDRIGFVTSVMKLPMRHPVVFAKEATSAAVLSGGRLALGVGSSPWPDDYAVVGLPWAGRGRRMDEAVEIVRGLSAGGYFGYRGECYSFPAVRLSPVPEQAIPILIGGHSEANLRRAARLGDGWISAGSTYEELAARLDRLAELRREFGRDGEPFAIHATTMESFSVDGVRRLEDLGVTHTGGGFSAFNPYQPGPDTEPLRAKLDALHRFADQVMGPSRG